MYSYGMDPHYMLFVLLPSVLLSALSQWYVRSTVRKYMEVPTSGGRTGADLARQLLQAAGINDVVVERTEGFLSDHYDPGAKRLRLSADNYDGHSVAAAGIAAHEAGHAIQHAIGYPLMWVRQKLVIPARLGSNLAPYLVMIGFAVHAFNLAWFGVFLFSAVFLFEVVTVPVEINASMRAGQKLGELGLVSGEEQKGVRSVLTAAALTYIAAMITSLMTLLYFISRLRGRDR